MGSPLKHFEVIERALLPNENVIMALSPCGIYDGNTIIMGGFAAVAFTNKRLICGQKALLMGSPTKVVNLEHINDVEKDTFGVIDGKIYIDTLKDRIGFSFNKDVIDRMFPEILQLLESYKSPSSPSSATISSADELKKFKELLDMGIITQEEFDAKKKQLLGL